MHHLGLYKDLPVVKKFRSIEEDVLDMRLQHNSICIGRTCQVTEKSIYKRIDTWKEERQ